ncbi:MAG: hypothetical protein JXR36_02065 [Bacteroidales bacterium]|nr:hypothetical protein [Bacteroidales bacterium]
MKFLFFFFVCFIITGLVFSQSGSELKDVLYYDLQGKVRSVEINENEKLEIHKFDETGKEIFAHKALSYDMNNIISSDVENHVSKTVCDNKGNKIWVCEYNTIPETNQSVETWTNIQTNVEHKSVYLYSDDGKLLSEVVSRPDFDNSAKIAHFSTNYFYNESDKLVRTETNELVKSQKIIEEYSLNKLGLVSESKIEVYEVGSNNTIIKSFIIKYDKKGNELEKSVLKNETEYFQIESKIKFDRKSNVKKLMLYDKQGQASVIKNKYKKGNLVYSLFTLHDGTQKYLLLNEYDEHGSLLKTSMQDYIHTELSSELEYKYIYDSNNNWIKRTLFVDGKSSSCVERTISYF